MLLHSCARYLASHLQEHCKIDETKKPVFIYGFELFLSTLASTLSIIIISLILGRMYTAITFLFIFIGIRLFAGGYHAKTYGRCFALTNAVYISVYAVSSLIPNSLYRILLPAFILCSTIVILIFAPIRHKNHPLSQSTYRKNQKIAWITTMSVDCILFLLIITNSATFLVPVASVTLAAVAVMMAIPKLTERRN